MEDRSQKRRPGSPKHKFLDFLILSTKLDAFSFYLRILTSRDLKVACAITSFQPDIQESSCFGTRRCSDFSLSPSFPLFPSSLSIIYLHICFPQHPAQCLARSIHWINISVMFIYEDSNWWLNGWMEIHVNYLFFFQSKAFWKFFSPVHRFWFNYLG